MSLDTRTLVERHLGEASDAHYAVLMCPAALQTPVAAAFALFATLRDMLAVQPDVLPTKVTWWHEELARLRDRAPVHPIAKTLCTALGDRADASIHDALDALLHGAVMDANSVEVTDDTLDDYLRLRAGALHALLDAILSTASPDDALLAAGGVHGIADVVSEARDPRYANRPNAALVLGNATSEDDLLAELTQRFNTATRALDDAGPMNVASAVWLALTRARWPAVVATAPGTVVPQAKPWRRLLLAWRAARRAKRPTN